MLPHLLRLRQTHFVLWRPRDPTIPPALIIGTYDPAAPHTLKNEQTLPLAPVSNSPGLWSIPAASRNLANDTVYHYFFEVTDANVYQPAPQRIRCTDPTACATDWRCLASGKPAAVILFKNQSLHPCDPDGHVPDFSNDLPMSSLPPNNKLVIYELPTAWTRTSDAATPQHVGVGTFRDVRRLLDPAAPAGHFRPPPGHLLQLGINALELLPPADTHADRSAWGYATSNYFAPDYDLGQPDDTDVQPPHAMRDLTDLIRACHANGVRFFYDAVMAFSNEGPCRNVNFLDFHVQWNAGDPEQSDRDGFGGDLWKYAAPMTGYDPLTGNDLSPLYPARQHMITHARHWMLQYHIDGLRLDSVTNVRNHDFLGAFRDDVRQAWNDRWAAEGNPATPGAADSRFLVIGESIPVHKNFLARLDALWNDEFKDIIRDVLLGRAHGSDNFEWSVRKMIDCRNLAPQDGRGYTDCTQAINYFGSHDVGTNDNTSHNARLYNYLDERGIALKDRHIKLAFACLLTAVGIPMIFAGDEFADEHDIRFWTNPELKNKKQTDPVNFDRATEPWRKSIFDYVSRLVKFRTQSTALSMNDCRFIHVDFTDGKRILAWHRGRPDTAPPVVVVANFSDWGTNTSVPNPEYRVPNWPPKPPGTTWQEITQSRPVPDTWIAREPIFPWEAKIYTAV